MRLLCVPYAGGGESVYAGWRSLLPADTELLLATLPGRGVRILEPPVLSLAEVVRAIADALAPWGDRPLALFGHSAGALVCFELAHELFARGSPPCHLLVSACQTPRHLRGQAADLSRLPDDELTRELVRIGGMPPALLSSPELLALFMPAIRADLAMVSGYLPPDRPPLPCPITALGGLADQEVPVGLLQEWRVETVGPFDFRIFEGGHFYIQNQQAELVRFVHSRAVQLRGAVVGPRKE
ncbi:thioesterase II family protein [Streptomyces sp. NPDC051218]|uniref:thioesterase II family protein n=1 Tax=Streptomyces sp. NPDC051218 TaxID=3365645 RepID=UPI00378C369F